MVQCKHQLGNFELGYFFGGNDLLLLLSLAALPFASGAILVCVSIYLYGLPKQDTSKLSQKGASSESKQKLITI